MPKGQAPDCKLRIIVFGGHPDDAECRADGTAVKWARLGLHVKLVSGTNDDFTTPRPFEPDIAVALDDAFEQKLDGLHEIASQVYEGRKPVPGIPAADDDAARRAWLKIRWSSRQRKEADNYRDLLVTLHGEETGRAVQFAETFQVSEYGRRPSPEELRKLFPFFEAK